MTFPTYAEKRKLDEERRARGERSSWSEQWDASPVMKDDRLRLATRNALANASLFTREQVREAVLPENLSAFRTYRNIGPKTIAELQRWLHNFPERTHAWDEQFGVAV